MSQGRRGHCCRAASPRHPRCHHLAVSPHEPDPSELPTLPGPRAGHGPWGHGPRRQGQGVKPQCGVNARLISRWSFPLQTIRQCPAGDRLRNQQRGGEVVIFGFSTQ